MAPSAKLLCYNITINDKTINREGLLFIRARPVLANLRSLRLEMPVFLPVLGPGALAVSVLTGINPIDM